MSDLREDLERIIKKTVALCHDKVPNVWHDCEEAQFMANLVLVEQIISAQKITLMTVRGIIQAAWAFANKVSTQQLDLNLFLFEFSSFEDRVKVL